MDGDRVAAVDEIPVDSTFLFTVRDEEGTEREAILVRVEDGHATDGGSGGPNGPGTEGSDADAPRGVAAWFNYCQHFTHIKLDKGSGAEFRGDEVVCTNHGAMFEADTGRCTFGPCEGAFLESIDVGARDGVVYLTDEDYEFDSVGPMETDPVDLESKSNIEF